MPALVELKRAALVGVIVLAAVAAGCFRSEQRPGPPLKLSVAEASQSVFALLYVADAKGFLKEAGLDVTFHSFRTGRDALASVLDGKSDLATVFETPVVIRIYEGQPLAIVSTLHSSTRYTRLIARRDRGITTPADLKGKRIGTTRNTNTEYFLSVVLATEGVAADSVTRVQVEPAAFGTALLGGDVDALVVFPPYFSALRQALGERAAIFHSDAYVETSMLVGTRATVTARPEAMVRLLRAITRAQDFVERHPEDSIRIVIDRLAGKVDADSVRETWPNVRPEAKLDHMLLAGMTLEANWLRDSGRFSGPIPDFGAAIVAEPLRAVRPQAVTLPLLPTAR